MSSDLIRHAAEIVASYVSNNEMPAKDVTGLLNEVFSTLNRMSGQQVAELPKITPVQESAPAEESPDTDDKKERRPPAVKTERKKIEPAVPIETSVSADAILCLVCGKPCKAIKGHLSRSHGIDLDEYRRRYNLDRDYPMVSPSYSERRRQLAIDAGLGEKLRASRKKV